MLFQARLPVMYLLYRISIYTKTSIQNVVINRSILEEHTWGIYWTPQPQPNHGPLSTDNNSSPPLIDLPPLVFSKTHLPLNTCSLLHICILPIPVLTEHTRVLWHSSKKSNFYKTDIAPILVAWRKHQPPSPHFPLYVPKDCTTTISIILTPTLILTDPWSRCHIIRHLFHSIKETLLES